MTYNSTLITKDEFFAFITATRNNDEISKEVKSVLQSIAYWEHADRLGIKCKELRALSGLVFHTNVFNLDGTYKEEVLEQIKPLFISGRVFKEEAFDKKFATKSQIGRGHDPDYVSNGARIERVGQGRIGKEYSVSPALPNSTVY